MKVEAGSQAGKNIKRHHDIRGRKDLEKLIQAFYAKAIPDSIIGFFFTDIANIQLNLHLPKIVNFWDRQLFNSPVYHGQPFQVHKLISLKATMSRHHFHRWQFLFCETVDELYSGDNAEQIKIKARMIAEKMGDSLAAEHNAADSASVINAGVQYFESRLGEPK